MAAQPAQSVPDLGSWPVGQAGQVEVEGRGDLVEVRRGVVERAEAV